MPVVPVDPAHSERCITELLSAQAGLVHQAAAGDSKDRHALTITTVGCGCITAATAGAGGESTTCVGLRRGSGGNDHRGGLGAEFKISRGEFAEGSLILKENDLAVGLTAKLKTDGYLHHVGIAHVFSASIHLALAVGAAKAYAALADGREYGVSVGTVEETGAFTGIAKGGDGVGIAVCQTG